MVSVLNFSFLPFDRLSLTQLYDIIKLRQEIFVVEQICPYLDADGKDLESIHVIGEHRDNILVCYARILPPGLSYPEYASIGRVICHQDFRKMGYGMSLMKSAIAKTKELYPDSSIKIGAQTYLKAFYESLGFTDIGEPYIEDGIPHMIMVLV
jgi:ElaA protein